MFRISPLSASSLRVVACRVGRFGQLGLLLATLAVAGAARPLSAKDVGDLRVGAAKVDITPASLDGLYPWGGGFTRVHDAIYARALVLDNGTQPVALIALDLIEVGDMVPLRRRIEKETGIPFDHIFITAAHTHSAPRLGRVSPGALAHNGSAESDRYSAVVYDQLIGLLRQAQKAMQPARVGTASSLIDVNVNREVYDAQGWHLGENPDGPSDKTLSVTRFESLTGKPIAVLFNYAVHPTVSFGSQQISGDLAGASERYVERELGEGAVALWTAGALGDQAPRLASGRPQGDSDRHWAKVFEAVDALGTVIGAEVVATARRITTPRSSVRLAAGERVVSCPSKPGPKLMATMTEVDAPAVDLRIGLLRIDETVFLGVSGEVVANIGARVKKASPWTNTVIMSISNDRIGYIADDAAYDRPAHSVNSSPAARGCAENAIVDGLLEMSRAL